MLDKRSLFEFKIERPDENIARRVKENWDKVSKPIDGLGDFENLICRIAAIKRDEWPDVSDRCAVIFCADNGIVDEGISQSDKSITLAVAKALGNGISSACCLGESANVKIMPVDIGIDCDEEISGVRNLKISKGTKSFLKEPAMSEEEVLSAIEAGISIVNELSKEGVGIISSGEMGIGNTTTSAAVLSAILDIDSDEITGRGAGLDDEGLTRKKRVIRKALNKYDFSDVQDEKERTFEILRTFGGLDIAGITGLFIGGAKYHVPVVIDGVISSTAAIIAEKLVPGTVDYMIPSHRGRERGNEQALKCLGLEAFINGNMALGEGTGAIMLFPILDMAMDYYKNGARFSDYEIDEYERFV
jgi:nicotinate-nucleotide--dimethylbenzimidazole phosphoribosyltransferase